MNTTHQALQFDGERLLARGVLSRELDALRIKAICQAFCRDCRIIVGRRRFDSERFQDGRCGEEGIFLATHVDVVFV